MLRIGIDSMNAMRNRRERLKRLNRIAYVDSSEAYLSY